MNFQLIIEDINELPPLSDIARIVNRLYKDGAANVNILQLVEAIESDVSLSANILHMINAPYYGLRTKITSISQAVTLFGTELVYGLVQNYAISATVKANMRPYGVSNTEFNKICHLQSALVTHWYSKIDPINVNYLASLALIMESGKLVVSREVVRSGSIKEFSAGVKESNDLILFEHQLFGSSSYYISGLLFDHWNMDPLMVEVLKGLDYEYKQISQKMDRYIECLDIVRTAINVKEFFTEKSLKDASKLVKESDLDVDDFLVSANYLKELAMRDKK